MDVGWKGRHSQEQKFAMCSKLESNHTLQEYECLYFNDLIQSDLLLFNIQEFRTNGFFPMHFFSITHSEIYIHCKSEHIILFWQMPNPGTNP